MDASPVSASCLSRRWWGGLLFACVASVAAGCAVNPVSGRTEMAVLSADKELAMLTRSILDILIDMASFITVPEVHVQERRVVPTADPETGPGGPIPPLVRIQSSAEKPGDAFVTVPYRGHWYWIDDRDLSSKGLFTFLMFLFTLVETGDKGAPPVVTIPAG